MVISGHLSMAARFHNGGAERRIGYGEPDYTIGTGIRMAVIPWRFSGGGAAIESARGRKADGRLKVEARSGCLFFGPYLDLMAGRCTVRVVLESGATGTVKMELAADRGKRILGEAEFELASLDGPLVI